MDAAPPDVVPLDGVATAVRALFGASEISVLSGGHQSTVFRCRVSGVPLVAKVVDASTDRAGLAARLAVVADLPGIARPLPVGGRMWHDIVVGGAVAGVVTAQEFVDGREPDPTDRDDTHAVGRALRALHDAMRLVDPAGIAPVRALGDDTEHHVPERAVARQLIHGDVTTSNLRVGSDGSVTFLDLDECGTGPVAYDLANAIHSVAVDVFVTGERDARARERAYTAALLEGYGADVLVADIGRLLAVRLDALDAWIADPARAPAGIRDASPEWHRTLRAFVAERRAQFPSST